MTTEQQTLREIDSTRSQQTGSAPPAITQQERAEVRQDVDRHGPGGHDADGAARKEGLPLRFRRLRVTARLRHDAIRRWPVRHVAAGFRHKATWRRRSTLSSRERQRLGRDLLRGGRAGLVAEGRPLPTTTRLASRPGASRSSRGRTARRDAAPRPRNGGLALLNSNDLSGGLGRVYQDTSTLLLDRRQPLESPVHRYKRRPGGSLPAGHDGPRLAAASAGRTGQERARDATRRLCGRTSSTAASR